MTEQHIIPEIIIEGIKKSIEVSRLCKDEDQVIRPKVGAVLIKNNQIIETAYRGEIEPGEHAEYTLIEKKCKIDDFSETILITTLEPCTRRSSNKKPCTARIVEKGIKIVWIGVNDPNPDIYIKGEIYLRSKGIKVEHFPNEFVEQILNLNNEFWDNEVKKYKYDLMLYPNQEVSRSDIRNIDNIIHYLHDYLSSIVEKERYVLCLGEKLPLIDDYHLFNFKDSIQESKDEEKYYYWSSLDYQNSRYSKKLDVFDNFLKSLNENKRILNIVKGKAGIGKSQFLKYLEYYYSKKLLNDLNEKLPILFDLNYWSLKKSIYSYCEDKIRSQSNISSEDFRYLLKSSRIIILMDAFNELNDRDKSEFIKDLKNVINLYPGLKIIISMKIDTEFSISFEEHKLNYIFMEEIRIENFKHFYNKLNISLNFKEFIEKVNLYNLNELVRIPLFFNYLIVYLKVQEGFPRSKYEIINNLVSYYFEDFIRKKFVDYETQRNNFAWQEFLETLSYYMHIKLEDNKIDAASLNYVFRELYNKPKKNRIYSDDLTQNDLLEFFMKYNILKLDEDYYKFNHEILFDYYCALKIVSLYDKKNKKIKKKHIFHKSNLRNPLIIAFPLIKNEKFSLECKKRNKILYCEGLLERNEIEKEEIDFMGVYLWNLLNSDYYYIHNIAFSLTLKLLPYIEQKEDLLIKIIENEKTSRLISRALLELGKLKSDKSKEFLLNFDRSFFSIRDRGVALCNYEDQTTLNLILDELKYIWYGAGYCSMLSAKLLELQQSNKLSQASFNRILDLFINPPKELKLSSNSEKKFDNEFSISWDYRSGLKSILIEQKEPLIVEELIKLLDYNKFDYHFIVEVISRLLDEKFFFKIIEEVLDGSSDYSRKIPLIKIIKDVSFKIDFNPFLEFIEKIPNNIKKHEEDIFYGNFIELFLDEDHFRNYKKEKLINFLPNLLKHGRSIQKAVIEVITTLSPKYFFKIGINFPIYYRSFEVLLNVISRHKYVEMKNFLISQARMCIPNWMHGVNKSFHNWFLFIELLNVLINIDVYEETKELFYEIIEKIEDWKKINPISLRLINKFKNSDRMLFISKIFEEYSKIDDDNQSIKYSFLGSLSPFSSTEYINFNLKILKKVVKTDYLLTGVIIQSLIALNIKEHETEILKIFNAGVNKNALSQMLRLISILASSRSMKILRKYLNNKDMVIRNRAFEGLNYKYKKENTDWYNNEDSITSLKTSNSRS